MWQSPSAPRAGVPTRPNMPNMPAGQIYNTRSPNIPIPQRPGGYDPTRGVPQGGQSFGGPSARQVPGASFENPLAWGSSKPSTPAGGMYGTPAQGGYITGAGTGDRRYYDTQMNNNMAAYQKSAGGMNDMYKKRIADLNKMLQGYGNQQLADARQAGTNLQNNEVGQLTGRGLANSTLAPAVQSMAYTAGQNNINRINEQLQNQKVGLAERTTGDALGYGERALNVGTQLGQSNIRDSRANFENDRNFGEGQFQSDRSFGRGNYENDRNFNRGVYEDDRNFGNANFDRDRSFNYMRNQDALQNAFRNRSFNYQQYLDALGRNDRLGMARLNFMENRTDSYPDMNQLMQLMQGMGQSNYAY